MKTFPKTIEDRSISGNLGTAIFDNYGQFIFIKRLSNKKCVANTEVYHQDFQKINGKKLENDLQNISWADALELHSDDVDKSFETILAPLSLSLIDMHH